MNFKGAGGGGVEGRRLKIGLEVLMGSKEDNCERTKQPSLAGAEGEVVPESGQEVKGKAQGRWQGSRSFW